jgi:N-formylglutamate deformylase
MLRYTQGNAPLVLDSPHSGVAYPADFGFACTMEQLRPAQDTHVEKLYDFAPILGATWIEALFPRSYLDVNRNTTEIDASMLDGPWPGPVESDARALAKVRLGKGLVWRCTDEGVPIYDRLLSPAEVQARIDRCWTPYHAALSRAISAAHAAHGYSIHINCHSMPSIAASHATEFPGLTHADFVVGDRDGTSADARLSHAICNFLRARGYTVDYNHPYKGVEILRRHGDPLRGRHSVQLEINRRLYMDERTLELADGMHRLRADLAGLAVMLVEMGQAVLSAGAG